jgi:hypothetical protein
MPTHFVAKVGKPLTYVSLSGDQITFLAGHKIYDSMNYLKLTKGII